MSSVSSYSDFILLSGTVGISEGSLKLLNDVVSVQNRNKSLINTSLTNHEVTQEDSSDILYDSDADILSLCDCTCCSDLISSDVHFS